MTFPKYVLHPGYVTSKNDGQEHFVAAARLAKLYGVPMSECVIKPTSRQDIARGWTEPPGAIHLYPDYSGNYSIPVGSKRSGAMNFKVADLSDRFLDAAVAKAEWLEYRIADESSFCLVRDPLTGNMSLPYRPSVLWELGGPIIEREKILVSPGIDDCPWLAVVGAIRTVSPSYGQTPLIAAMLAYVANKFGDEVEL